MSEINMKLNGAYINEFQKKLLQEGVECHIEKESNGFLPKEWIEVVVPLTPVLISILYEIWKNAKTKKKILVKTDDTYVALSAREIESLEVRLKRKKRKSE